MNQAKLGVSVGSIGSMVTAFALVVVYCLVASLSHGSHEWWYIDFVAGGNVYWGDDAYRYFLARSAWHDTNLFWFNFMLPAAAFLDGVVTTLAGDSLFHARAIKSIPLAASILLTYHAAVRLGAARTWATVAAALLACMPLYVLVGLSFYGEAWFAFLVSLSLYLLTIRSWRLAGLAIGIMPLVRLEALPFVAGYMAWMMVRRDWRNAAVVLAPGLLYGLLVVVFGPGIPGFLAWRFDVMKVYEAVGIWYGGSFSQFFEFLFWPWSLCALVALLGRDARPILPCIIGAVGICGFQVIAIVFNTGRFEPRFLVPLCPVLAVGFALFVSSQARSWGQQNFRLVFRLLVTLLVGATFLAQVSSIHVARELREYVLTNFRLPPSVKARPFEMATYFKRADESKIGGYREYADVAMRMIELNPSIETLIVSPPQAFYFLDPSRIPDSTNVVFALFGRSTLDPVLGREMAAGYFSRPPFFGRFSLATPKPGSRLVLYLDEMDLPRYPMHWNVRGNDIFLFSGGLADPVE